MSSLASAWRTLRSEPLRSAFERLADRRRDLRRERSFVWTREPFDAPAAVLNLVPFQPRRLWGGTAVQLIARLESEAGRRAVALLSPGPQGTRLEWQHGEIRKAGGLGEPWRTDPLALEDPGFERSVESALARTGSTVLHVESVARVPLTSLLRVSERDLRLVISVHDFALFCPRPHLVEAGTGRFCDFCRDAWRCRECLTPLGGVSLAYQDERRRRAAELLARADAVVFPSASHRRAHVELFGEMPRGAVIAPAVPLPSPSPARTGSIRRVAYAGALQAHKGAGLLPDIARLLQAAGAGRPERFLVLGAGDAAIAAAVRSSPGLLWRGWYRSGSLPGRLRRERVDLALLLSICPESYSLALDECMTAGVPVLALDAGALGDRVREMACGLVLPRESGAAGVAEAVAELVSGRRSLALRPERWQTPTPRAAADAYLELYRDLPA